jgi:uncharacterized membrane protein HdeD (DUF308 family)
MAGTSSSLGGPMANVTHRWGWFVALGIVMIVLGVIAWLDVVAVTVAGTLFIGAMLLVGGGFQIVHAFMAKGWRDVVLGLLSGVLYVFVGLLIMSEPLQGALVLTLVISAALVVGGIVRIVLALRHREMASWGLLLFSGIVSVAVGILLYASLPWSGLWVLGTLIAIELLVQGLSWLYLGLALRRRHVAA